jgi:hypothetical protein
MGRFGNRKDRNIARELRGLRSEARPEFTEELAAHVHASRRPAPRVWSRAAFATAIAVFMLGTFASFGALSYAASGTTSAVGAVKRVVVANKVVKREKSSAQDQYSQPKVVTPKESSGGVAGEVTKPSTSAVAKPSGTLPFTGTGLLGTAALGLTFLTMGIFLRRREHRA